MFKGWWRQIPERDFVRQATATPVLLYAAIGRQAGLFRWLLLACLLSDIADGLIARVLPSAVRAGARLDYRRGHDRFRDWDLRVVCVSGGGAGAALVRPVSGGGGAVPGRGGGGALALRANFGVSTRCWFASRPTRRASL